LTAVLKLLLIVDMPELDSALSSGWQRFVNRIVSNPEGVEGSFDGSTGSMQI